MNWLINNIIRPFNKLTGRRKTIQCRRYWDVFCDVNGKYIACTKAVDELLKDRPHKINLTMSSKPFPDAQKYFIDWTGRLQHEAFKKFSKFDDFVIYDDGVVDIYPHLNIEIAKFAKNGEYFYGKVEKA